MSNELDLLRMLEPAVRPDGVGRSGAAKQPIESQSFESLLESARSTAAKLVEETASALETEEAPAAASTVKAADDSGAGGAGLGELAGFDRIENASLRMLMMGQPEDQAG